MAVSGAYLSSGSTSALSNPGALVPELSRRARGFVLWAGLRQLGKRGVGELVLRCVQLARRLGAELATIPGIRVLNDVVFNQVVVSAEPRAGTPAEAFIPELAVALQRVGTGYPTPTIWRGAPALRFSVSNAETRPEDIHQAVAAVRRVHAALSAAPP
jgi:glutamate/tyrosine decarboxylase-like PLP-dependent enzyme